MPAARFPLAHRYWMQADGLSLDVRPFVPAVEFADTREACVVGQPASRRFEQVLADLEVDAAQAAMVGDHIESDIGGALQADPALVRTRKYRGAGGTRIRARTARRARLDPRGADATRPLGAEKPARRGDAGWAQPRSLSPDRPAGDPTAFPPGSSCSSIPVSPNHRAPLAVTSVHGDSVRILVANGHKLSPSRM